MKPHHCSDFQNACIDLYNATVCLCFSAHDADLTAAIITHFAPTGVALYLQSLKNFQLWKPKIFCANAQLLQIKPLRGMSFPEFAMLKFARAMKFNARFR